MSDVRSSDPDHVNASPERHASTPTQPRFVISRNQALAIKKYPTLVEFLGRPEGVQIAREVAGEINKLMSKLVAANSKEANEFAVTCKADKHNLKQYFRGEDWLCRVTASGPFRGDEAIYYSREKDVACVLRREEAADGSIKYADISDRFNLIFEAESGEIPSEEIEQTVEESVDKIASTEEQEENS